MRILRLHWAILACGGCLWARGAAAADPPPVRLHGELAAAHAISGHQKDELGWGIAGTGAGELALNKMFGIELELGSLWVSKGSNPSDPRFEPGGSATANTAALGLRVRPFGNDHHGLFYSPAGLWFAGDTGITLTNGLTRGMFDLHAGYDFLDPKGQKGIGPMVALFHVFQPDSALRPDDANILLVGVHALFDLGPGLNPDSDRDHDGILDDKDACPDVPEDKDGFQDSDGCPDDDNDKDGIPDKVDHCPDAAEDKDGFEDKDGCPDPDNDKDGILDPVDKCPNDPEDKDGFEDNDGCPDLDNDKDGIPDAKDLCPNEPETFNGYADADGCPDEDQVRVVGDKIVLDDRVHFYVNSFIIRSISHPLLTRLAKLISDHPEYVHVSIEGHADEVGPANFNQKLSEDRARAVLEFLVKQGVAPARLSSVGYGESHPLVEQKSEYAHLLNRRVEFTVTRQLKADGSAVVSAPVANPTALPMNPNDAPTAPAAPQPTAPDREPSKAPATNAAPAPAASGAAPKGGVK